MLKMNFNCAKKMVFYENKFFYQIIYDMIFFTSTTLKLVKQEI